MAVGMPVDAGGAADPAPSRRAARWWTVAAAAPAVAAAAALALPWWRADRGPSLLDAGPSRSAAPDVWAGFEVAGPRAVVVVALAVAVLAVVVLAVVARAAVHADTRGGVGARSCVAGAGAATSACGAAALVGWGPTAAPGAWLAAAAGLAAVGAAVARRGASRAPVVVTVALLAAGATLAIPEGEPLADRAASGPFVPVAGTTRDGSALRSGAGRLYGWSDGSSPAVVDGAPGLVTEGAVVVAGPRGRARVLARTGPGAPPPLGVAGDLLVRWVAADAVAATDLRPDGPQDVVVRDVATASRVGDDGSVWLTSDVDPTGTVRRFDAAVYRGQQGLSATWLPVVTIRNPPGEGPLDVREVRPVPGGALRVGDGRRIELLTGTAAGIAVRPLMGASSPEWCGARFAGTGGLRVVAADATGVWFPTVDRRLAHVRADGTVRTVEAPLPAPPDALAAPGDGSLLFTTGDAGGGPGDGPPALWRLPDAAAALGDPVPAC
jgi:hypothetical protein